MTQRYILVRRRHTAFRYPSNKRIPSYVPLLPFCAHLRLSRSLLPLLSRAGSRPALSRLGAQLAKIQLPISRMCDATRRRNFRRVSALYSRPRRKSCARPLSRLDPISRDTGGNSEEVPAEEGHEISNFQKISRESHVSRNRRREVNEAESTCKICTDLLTILLYF